MNEKRKAILGVCLAIVLLGIAGYNLRKHYIGESTEDPQVIALEMRFRIGGEGWTLREARLVDQAVSNFLDDLFDWMEDQGKMTEDNREVQRFLQQQDIIRPLKRSQPSLRTDWVAFYHPQSGKILLNEGSIRDTLETSVGLLCAAELGLEGRAPEGDCSQIPSDDLREMEACFRNIAAELGWQIKWVELMGEWVDGVTRFLFVRRLEYYYVDGSDRRLEYGMRADLFYFAHELDRLKESIDQKDGDSRNESDEYQRIVDLREGTLALAFQWELDDEYEPLGTLIAGLRKVGRGRYSKMLGDDFGTRMTEITRRALEYHTVHPVAEEAREFMQRNVRR